MAETPREDFREYLSRLGEHINLVYDRLKKIEARINDMADEISEIKTSADVNRDEFNNFINKFTESLKELLPPPTEESTQEENDASQN